MRRSAICRVAVIPMALVLAVPLAAQQQPPPQPPPSASQASYTRAREILDAARKAHVGEKQLPGVDDVSFKITGTLNHRNQSPSPDGEPVTTPFDAMLLVDYKRDWTIWERTGSFPGGFHFSNRWILKSNEGVNADLIRRVVTPVSNAANLTDNARRRLPQHVLRMAFDRAATLRHLGEVERDGKKLNAVAFAGPTGTQFVLLFDAQTSLLAAWETMSSDSLFGDVTNETIFTGYTEAGGIQWPTGQVTKTGGVLTQDVRYSDWKLNAQPAASVFEPPAGFTPREPPARPTGITVNQVAPNVYLMDGVAGGGYRVLFVAFRDFILVVEAPQNEAFSRAAIQKIRETVPGKPIRYVAVTHHHDDHAGGVRGYMAEGAAIVTTPGNLPYFRRSLQSPFTIAPDSYARTRPDVIGDAIQNKKAVFTDSVQTVELHDIGPSPHAQEFLVVWIPEHKILFQGDLHTDVNGGRGSETLAHFAEWIEKMKLPVEKILGVHGPASVTLADLHQAVAQFKAAK